MPTYNDNCRTVNRPDDLATSIRATDDSARSATSNMMELM